uniref:LemA family protein (LemA) n=1 Tax=uncultured marine group II/III euryarchaeote KM3_68_H12 TaxID=1456487 RepID=A0A075HEN6_9EURY|nr:LemA family protein (lemA) [uncultured marine group II/III euryarchaeote KM3_68_H12]
MAGIILMGTVVVVIVLLMLIFWIISAYNRLVDLRNEVENQYQNLETQIGVKDQKIAFVEETDLAQLGLESSVYDKIIDARKQFASAKSSGNRADMMAANGLLDSVIPQVLAFAEDNPELTSHHVLVAGLEEGVQAIAKMANEVEEYNQAAKNYNTVAEMFPTLLVARMFGFSRADLFDIYSREQVEQMFDRRASLGSFVESKQSDADLKTAELKDEIAAIEAETELMKAKAELAALKEKMAEDE